MFGVARHSFRASILLVLCMGGAAMAAGPDFRLVDAVASQDSAATQTLLKQHVDVNAARSDGSTALLWAAHWNDLELVDQLLKAGANVNAAEDHGVTPLARAAENASSPMVEKLLAAHGDPNRAQTSGQTPLMVAAHTGSVRVVKALLAAGANVNATTENTNGTALMWAVAWPHPEIARVLIEGRADVHASTAKGLTPLMMAAQNGDIPMARMLIAAGVNVNEPGGDGTAVLPFSIVAGQPDFALFLLEQGADPNGAMNGVRALHAAVGNVNTWLDEWTRKNGRLGRGGLSAEQRLPLVKALVARGADLNARITTSGMFMSYIGAPRKGAFEPFACGTGDLRGATPLWVAAFFANGNLGGSGSNDAGSTAGPRAADIVRLLLEAGADQFLTTNDGTTPFMVAAGLGRATFTPGRARANRSESAEDAVKILLDAGADINAVNEADFTALHGAAYRGLNEVVQLLVERGAKINARDYRGRTPYRLAEGSKQSFQFQAWPETAALLEKLGADVRLGLAGTVQERLRDINAAVAQP
jgi:uncharacterized protein